MVWAQGRRPQALAELDALDRAAAAAQSRSAGREPRAASAPPSRRRGVEAQAGAAGAGKSAATTAAQAAAAPPSTRHAFARGVVLLGVGRAREAEPLLAEAARVRQRLHGAGHYETAIAQGLQGVALWADADAARRERGAELLKQAVLDLHAPRNADLMNDRGLRRPLRETVFAAYVDAMAARGGLPALWAMGVADGLRSGITAQAMADAAVRAATADPALAALVRQEQDARRELQAAETLLQEQDPAQPMPPEAAARLRTRVAEVEAARQQVQQRIRERFPGYDRIVRPPLPDPGQVAQRLTRGEALVMLMPQERALLAWVVTADELPSFVRIDIGEPELRTLVARVRRALDFAGGPPTPFDQAAAQALYRRIFGPLEPRLAAHKQLVLAASGPLAILPFATLQGEARAGEPPAWLVRRWALTQVPSVNAWLALRQMPRGQGASEPLLAWGDPVFSRDVALADRRRPLAGGRGAPAAGAANAAAAVPRYDELPPLPETRDELLAIASALKADPARDLLLGSAATRASLVEANRSGQLAKKRVVVFATHGLMAGDLPGLRQPALAMAVSPASRRDDFAANLLTLDDVLTLKLNADWVVLSACNTAAGDGRAEEALSGLARGFFYAGSRSLLVTQWAVETESAKRLTAATFEHQARSRDAGKAESLRQAMLTLMAEPRYAHPAYWAPYMLVGDGAR